MLLSLRALSLRVASRGPQRGHIAVASFHGQLRQSTMAKRKHSSIGGSPAVKDTQSLDRTKVRHTNVPVPTNAENTPKLPRRQSSRGAKAAATNPNIHPDIIDGVNAMRASPDGHEDGALGSHHRPNTDISTADGQAAAENATTAEKTNPAKVANGNAASSRVPNANGIDSETTTSNAPREPSGKGKRKKPGVPHVKVEQDESNIAVINDAAANVTGPTADAATPVDPDDIEGLAEDEVEIKEALSRPPPVNSEYLPLPWKGRLGYVSPS